LPTSTRSRCWATPSLHPSGRSRVLLTAATTPALGIIVVAIAVVVSGRRGRDLVVALVGGQGAGSATDSINRGEDRRAGPGGRGDHQEEAQEDQSEERRPLPHRYPSLNIHPHRLWFPGTTPPGPAHRFGGGQSSLRHGAIIRLDDRGADHGAAAGRRAARRDGKLPANLPQRPTRSEARVTLRWSESWSARSTSLSGYSASSSASN